jgi:excisionase family DNA binding protein
MTGSAVRIRDPAPCILRAGCSPLGENWVVGIINSRLHQGQGTGIAVRRTQEMKESFSTSEVATFCHVTADTIRKWAEAGRIIVFKTPGGHRRIRREDLLFFLRENNIPLHRDLREAQPHLLVIDPEESVIASVKRFLERSRMTVDVSAARNAFEAGLQCSRLNPDVVFMDLQMPGLDTMDLCRTIREFPETSSTKIIATASADQADLLAQAAAAGAVAAVAKPFNPDDLRRALAQAGMEVA